MTRPVRAPVEALRSVMLEMRSAAEYLDKPDYPLKPLGRGDLLEWANLIDEALARQRTADAALVAEIDEELTFEPFADAGQRRALQLLRKLRARLQGDA